MATEANLAKRVGRLVQIGRLYRGQTVDSMRRILNSESSSWRCLDASTGKMRSWGSGPNEDMDSMVREAIYQLEGLPVGPEYYEWPEYVKKWVRLAYTWMRLPGSPYVVPLEEVAGFLMDCNAESVTPLLVKRGGDSKRWCEEPIIWERLKKQGCDYLPATKAIALHWLLRYEAFRAMELDMYFVEEKILPYVIQYHGDPRRLKRIMVALYWCKDIGLAEEIAKSARSFKEAEEQAMAYARVSGIA